MKKIAVTTLIAVVAVGAFAAGPQKTPKTIKCAVMGGNVDVAKATKSHNFADYNGRRYFFCCAGCPQEFKANPSKYAKSPSIPTPKSK